ncbi:hypothetical protein [Lacticaseibacillus sp. GG6-2]
MARRCLKWLGLVLACGLLMGSLAEPATITARYTLRRDGALGDLTFIPNQRWCLRWTPTNCWRGRYRLVAGGAVLTSRRRVITVAWCDGGWGCRLVRIQRR